MTMTGDTLTVLYRDSDIICCIKEPGTISESPGMPDLIRRAAGEQYVYPVHRLDRETGGAMVYALNAVAAAALSGEFAPEGSAEKIYLAVIEGTLQEKEGTLRDLLFRDRNTRRSYVVDRMRKGVREAELSYSVTAEKEGLSLISVRLHSGRTHQIRVQFSHRGHPVAGDRRYGSKNRCGLALWAECLSFHHPSAGNTVTVSCRPPDSYPWDLFRDEISGHVSGA